MVRLVCLCGILIVFRRIFFSSARPHCTAIKYSGNFCSWISYAPGGRLVVWKNSRQKRKKEGNDFFSAADVARLTHYCSQSVLSYSRHHGTCTVIVCKITTGPQRWRRVWHLRHL